MKNIKPHAVELLRDDRGVYGIEGVDDVESTGSISIITRPDKLLTHPREGFCQIILQPIFGCYRYGLFHRTIEERLQRAIHWRMLENAGLAMEKCRECRGEYANFWSSDLAQQVINRGIYHGLRRASIKVVNHLIREALAVADQDALKAARRFPFSYRYRLYVAGATHLHNLQLIEAFPALASKIFGGTSKSTGEAREMALRGEPLREIAKHVGVPWWMKRIKPGVVGALELRPGSYSHPEEIEPALVEAYLPPHGYDMKMWLRAVSRASVTSPDFGAWVAKNLMEDQRLWWNERKDFALLDDLDDWATASLRSTVPAHVRRAFGKQASTGGEEFITRVFDRHMSIETVLKLSGEWHEAVAANMTGPDCEFPPSWFPAQRIGDLDLVPITTAADLYREGKAMHHCVGTYAEYVNHGSLSIFSILKDGERVATVSFDRGAVYGLREIRGPCNAAVPQIEKAIRAWLRKQVPPKSPTSPFPFLEASRRRELVALLDTPDDTPLLSRFVNQGKTAADVEELARIWDAIVQPIYMDLSEGDRAVFDRQFREIERELISIEDDIPF